MRALIAIAAIVLTTASAAGQAPAGQTLSGNISVRGARAVFPLELQAGQVVTLTTSTASELDTVLSLANPSGRQVAANDDEQPGVLTSRIVYVVRSSGRHTATVSSFGATTGAFELRVTQGLDVGLSPEARTLREERVTLDRRRTEARFPVELSADDVFVASTFAISDRLDTTLTLLDSSGAVLAQNDDMGEGNLNSQVIYRAAAAGRYEVVASTYDGTGTGDLLLSLAIDPNAEAPFNFASLEGEVIARHEGALGDEQPSREYRVTLNAGQTLLAVADVTSGNLDPVLRLNGPDGNPVAFNDDRGDGSLNSAIAYTAAATGAYTLELSRFRQSATSGEFRLNLLSVDASVVATLQGLIENQVTLSGAEQTIETRDFRVHYTLEGRDASTRAYSQSVAETLQEMLGVQTGMGWAAPVRDADGRYRAYVADARGVMGYVKPVQIVFDNPSTANVRERLAARGVLVIDNDFRGMGKKAPPESLMRATATHELNHMVQYGYDAEEGLQWLYEATASWIETATAGEDQDATDYVATDFAAPELCWTTRTGGHNYAQWTLLQSLADVHGNGIVTRIWESAITHDGFETMSQTLAGVNTTIPDAIQRWRVQNFARDYALAPRFSRAVALAGTISRDGSWSPRGRIQQLGANYVRLRTQGSRHYALRGEANLELIALGQREGRIEAIPLGRGGVFDASGYEYAALLVFNRAVPATPGDCRNVNYSINVNAAQGAAPAPRYHFNATHFTPPM